MTNAHYVLPYRRKREGRTNYKKRLAMLKSGKPRLIIRRSNKHLLLQLAHYHPDGDQILVSVDSKALAKQGWSHSTKSVPASYFAGVLLAQAAKQHQIGEAIVDLGLQHHRAGTRVCAAIKGAIDGGLAIPAGEEIFPSAERIAGKHISPEVEKDTAALAQKLGIKLPEIKAAPKKEAKPAAGGKPEAKKGAAEKGGEKKAEPKAQKAKAAPKED